jgi:hypothetical protein
MKQPIARADIKVLNRKERRKQEAISRDVKALRAANMALRGQVNDVTSRAAAQFEGEQRTRGQLVRVINVLARRLAKAGGGIWDEASSTAEIKLPLAELNEESSVGFAPSNEGDDFLLLVAAPPNYLREERDEAVKEPNAEQEATP